jgi:hypothetical protein
MMAILKEIVTTQTCRTILIKLLAIYNVRTGIFMEKKHGPCGQFAGMEIFSKNYIKVLV